MKNAELKAQLTGLPLLYHTRTRHEVTRGDRREHSYLPNRGRKEHGKRDK